jgi:FkbM family methyltransferase
MPDLHTSVLEAINHLITKHKQLAPVIEQLAARSQGKRLPQLLDTQKLYFGLNDLDAKLARYIDYENGFFIELGANDGVSQSNTLHFEIHKGWSGILIEPTPHNFLECLKNRGGKNKIFCNACVSFEYKEKFVEIAYSNLMSTPMGLDSDIRDPFLNALTGKQFLAASEDVFIFGAVARNLNSILIESNAPKTIDLLSLDVEGAELEVLKGIDHREFSFKFICVECRDIQRMENYLKKLNYVLIEKLTEHDYLFKKFGN